LNHTLARRAATIAALAIALTGCDGDQAAPTPAAATGSPTVPASLTPSPSSASPSPTASPSPSVDPYALLPMGKSFTKTNRSATATVYSYRHNVARSAPRPDEQPGYVWGAIDVKVCISKTFTGEAYVNTNPWTLAYADDTQIESSSVGYQQFPEPEYPWGDKRVAAGRCIRGWITFPVPAKPRPVAVEYAPDSEPVAPRWEVK
jgi:hypothetical protein